ncbi:MAG TPA: MarR family transcriptional regulator [Sphingobium sp.]|nr:MarR family transcriptional regulator [Sphingobium sp.]
MRMDHDEANDRSHAGAAAATAARGDGSGLVGPLERVHVDRRPTMLLVGAGAAGEHLVNWATRAGLRCVGQVAPEAVAERLGKTVSLDLILLDLRGMDVARCFSRAAALALAGHHGVPGARLAVMTDLAGLDAALAMLDAPETEFLCEPPESDIIALLVMAALRPGPDHAIPLHDATRDTEIARFERLSDEVRRLAVTIERMALGEAPRPAASLPVTGGVVLDRYDAYRGEADRGAVAAPMLSPAAQFPLREKARSRPAGEADLPSHAEVRQLIRARRMRDQFLPAALFADPAWDMMLDLLAARLSGQNVSVSSLCIAASVPPTTALRWIRQLTDRAVFARIDDPADGRRVFIQLTDSAAEAMLGWVQAVRRNGGLLTERR